MNELLPTRLPGCPTDLELESLLLHESSAQPRHATHVSECDACARRLEWMRAADVRFREEVFPATVAAVRAAIRPPPRRSRLVWLAALPAAAALALLVRTSPEPGPGYVGAKGAPVALEVFTDAGGSVRRLGNGDQVPANAGLRFVARAPGRSIVLVTVDGTGKVSRLVPTADAPPAADGLLPGGALLDGIPGPERIFAVFLDGRTRVADVERAAREAYAGGGADRVRTLQRLPVPLEQESLLLEKAEPRR